VLKKGIDPKSKYPLETILRKMDNCTIEESPLSARETY
jgi:hypothetical protein